MECKTINGTKYGVEKLKAIEGFKLQLKTVKMLDGVVDALKGVEDFNSLSEISKMDTNELFEALGNFIKSTDDEKVFEFVMGLLRKNVYVIGVADDTEVKIPLDVDVHMEDKLIDIFQVAIFVLEINLKKSLGGIMSKLPSLKAKVKTDN
ncbi:MAG: hypothetical protein U9Q29_02800 [Campylobacterota bacterium]|nr:hypothetical protein [Campylobacterota bacterium]